MFGLFKKEKSMSEVSKDFAQQFDIVRLILFEYFIEVIINAFKKQGDSITEEDAATYAAGVVTYLSGDDVDEWAKKLNEKQQIVALAVIPNIKKQVDSVLALDKSLREALVYTLRMKMIVKSWQQQSENTSDYLLKTPEGKRIGLLLNQYGSEFSDSPTPDGYKHLVYGLMMTAEARKKEKK